MDAHLVLDAVLAALLLGHAWRGWHIGGVASISAMAGTVGGGALALWLAPDLLARHLPAAGPVGHAALLLLAVVLAAIAGEALLGGLGVRLRARATRPDLRLVDATLGALATLLATALVATTLATAVRPVLPRAWTQEIRESHLLPILDRMVPEVAQRWGSRATQAIQAAGFPRVFSDLQPEPRLPAAPPDQRAARTPAVRAAAASVVKVEAEACRLGHEGSGWVVAPHRVVTNAHVVAGATSPTVQVTGQGRRLAARVVAYDARMDMAILDVPELTARPLKRSGELGRGANAAVAGFPLGGSYTVGAARVRGVVMASGDDIYGRSGAAREVYALAATVQPGNSGGPLLTDEGTVAGTVFARSTVDAATGYALTNASTLKLLASAGSLRTPVPTGECLRG